MDRSASQGERALGNSQTRFTSGTVKLPCTAALIRSNVVAIATQMVLQASSLAVATNIDFSHC
jgi:hypothetical protein